MINLKIDPEFQNQIPPLTDDEYKQLEENILKEGKLLSPLIVWNNTLVDGHNRYEIVQEHPEISFSTMPLPFESREEVLAWICKNQLGRRNLTPEQKKFLIGKQYSVEHRKPGGNGNNQHTAAAKKTAPEELCQIDTIPPTSAEASIRKQIAERNNVSESYVARSEKFMCGVEIMEQMVPGMQENPEHGLNSPFRCTRRTTNFNASSPINTDGLSSGIFHRDVGDLTPIQANRWCMRQLTLRRSAHFLRDLLVFRMLRHRVHAPLNPSFHFCSDRMRIAPFGFNQRSNLYINDARTFTNTVFRPANRSIMGNGQNRQTGRTRETCAPRFPANMLTHRHTCALRKKSHPPAALFEFGATTHELFKSLPPFAAVNSHHVHACKRPAQTRNPMKRLLIDKARRML